MASSAQAFLGRQVTPSCGMHALRRAAAKCPAGGRGRLLALCQAVEAPGRPHSTTEAAAPDPASTSGVRSAAEAAPLAFKAAIDWRYIKSNLEAVRQNVARRNSAADPDRVVECYDAWRALQAALNAKQAERNDVAKQMKGKLPPEERQGLVARGKELKAACAELEARVAAAEEALQREGQRLPNATHPQVGIPPGGSAQGLTQRGDARGSGCPTQRTPRLFKGGRRCKRVFEGKPALGRTAHALVEERQAAQQCRGRPTEQKGYSSGHLRLQELRACAVFCARSETRLCWAGLGLELKFTPLLVIHGSSSQVPVGGEEAAAVLRTLGSKPSFAFPPRDHLALGAALGLLDFEAGAAAAGAKFVYLRRAAALLELALCNWAMQRVAARGFEPVSTPDLVRESVLEKCGFQPRAENTQVYSVPSAGLCLTGTAEVPLGALHMDQLLAEEQLPLRYAAFGHCFRTEAGSGGSASRGLYRVHQFSKVELFVVAAPGQSDALLDELVALEEELFKELGFHCRVLDMPTGDLGAPAYRKIDIEAWMPGLDRFGEVSSASNCTDYQARRLNIRYRPAAKEGGDPKAKQPTEFVHTLNATACAVPRMVVTLLEQFQQKDGSVLVPEALQPFLGGLKQIGPGI